MVLKFTTDGEVQFGKTVKALDAEMNNAAKTYRQNIAVMGQNASKTAQLTAEKKKLENQMKLGRERTKLLGEEYDRLATSQGKNSEAAIKAKGKVIESENAELALEKSLQKVNKELKQQGNLSIETAEKLEKISKTGDKFQSVGKKVSVGVTAPIMALGATSLKSFSDMRDSQAKLINQTGKTGEEAKKLKESLNNLYGNSAKDSGELAEALGTVVQRFDVTGKASEDMTSKFLTFARVNNVEAPMAIEKVSRAMGDAGIETKDYSSVLDLLTVAHQKSGIQIETLTENLAKYGAPMRQLGFDTKSSIAIFAGWEKAGVNTEIAFSGMKKAISTWGKEGKVPLEEFPKAMEKIKNSTNPVADAIQVFGAKAGPDLADAISQGRFSMDDMMKALEEADGKLDKTAKETANPMAQLKVAIHNVQLVLIPFGEMIAAEIAPRLKQFAEFMKGVNERMKAMDPNTRKMIITIGLVLAAIGPALVIFGKVASSIVKISKAISVLKNGLSAFMGFLKIVTLGFNPWVLAIAAVIAIFVLLYTKCEWFRDGVHAILKFIGELFVGTWNVIKEGIKAFIDYNIQVFNFWKGMTSGIFEAFLQNVSNVFGGVQRIFGGIVDFVAGVFTGDWSRAWQGVVDIFGGIFDTLVALAKAPLNMVIGLVNGAIKGLNNIKVPDWVPGLGGKGINIPTIPLLATGGHVLEGQAIVGEAGPELLSVTNGKTTVTPLSDEEKRQGISGKYKGNITVEQHNHFGKVNTNSPSELLELDRQIARTNRQSLAGVGVIA